MLDFLKITLEQREKMEKIRLEEGRISSSHAFVSIFIWSEVFGLTASVSRDGFTVMTRSGDVYFPCGTDSYKHEAVGEMLRRGAPLHPDTVGCYNELLLSGTAAPV